MSYNERNNERIRINQKNLNNDRSNINEQWQKHFTEQNMYVYLAYIQKAL